MDQFLSIIFFDSRLGAPRRPLPRLPEREYRARARILKSPAALLSRVAPRRFQL